MSDIPEESEGAGKASGLPPNSPKRAIILDEEDGSFAVEYDNNVGTKNVMRLDATTYEEAIDEVKSFLSIDGDRDEHGTLWQID